MSASPTRSSNSLPCARASSLDWPSTQTGASVTFCSAVIRRYGAAVGAAGGLGLQLLGLGLNGHIGFNEPPCGAESRSRCLTLSASTRAQNAGAFGGNPQAVPGQAITLGLAEILAAREIVLVVTGAAKAPVLQRLLQDPPGPQLPASWLHRHPAVTLVVDRAAWGRG